MAANYLNVTVAAIIATLRNGCIKLPLGIAAGLLAGVAALFTISPGIGGAVLTLGLLFWALTKNERPIIARCALWLSIAFATAVLISTTLSPGLISASRTNVEPAYSIRVQVWMNTLERALEYPVFGRGTGTNTAEVFFVAPSGQRQFLTDAHNAWLNILGQSGIIGLITFSLLCAYCWSMCRFRFGSLDHEQVMLLAASCGLIGALFYQNLFGSYEDARHLWVWIGFIAAAHRRVELNRQIANAAEEVR
jgi:O-antigen ligase